MKSTLIFSKQIMTAGTAGDTEKIAYVEHHFDKPTDIMVQAVLTASTFNRQQTSYWKTELTVDSWEAVENGKPVVHSVPQFTVWNPFEIKNCNWVKVRLSAVNGSGSGIVNIYG